MQHTGGMDALRTRPSAETFPLDDLVEFARKGRVRVPSFQRGLRWTRRDVVLLFDSILKGYPVGSLLLWERDAPAEPVELGPLKIDAEAGPAYYVVDGQQRITALASALTEAGWADPRFAVGYDLEGESFTARPPRGSDAWVPAHVLYDLSTLLTWFRDRTDLAEWFDAAAAVSKTLRDLRLPAYVVRQDDEAVLRGIFDRMNNAGKKLTRGEVFAALHRSGGSADEVTLDSIAEQLQLQTGFGTLDSGLMMQIVLARRGADVMREIRNEFEPAAKGRDVFAASEAQAEAYRRGEEAAVRAVRFLENVAGVPHLAFLPYQYLLVTLARFFAHHPEPSPRHQRLLRRFFWRAVVSGPSLVPGSTTGVSRMLNRQIDPQDELASISGLMTLVGVNHPAYPAVEPFRANTAASKVLLCAMWQQGPRDLISGLPVTDEELRTVLGDRSTATGVVAAILTGPSIADHEHEAGNRLLLVPQEDRETSPLDVLGSVTENVLGSHSLETEDLDVLHSSDASQVLELRAGRLEKLQQAFLEQMCEWDHEDSPDLAMLASRAEEPRASA